MSALPASPPRSSGSRPRRPLVPVIAVVLLIVALAALATWWLVFRDDAPPPVDIRTATSGLEGSGVGDVAIEGTWVVDPTVVAADGQGSFAGFRVEEELAQGIGRNTVVARTPAVEGQVVISGTTVERTEVTVDVRTLATDDQRRDDRLREAIAAEQFPEGTFRLAQPIELGEVREGEPVSATATGQLTIKGVTAPVTVDVDAQLDGDVVTVVGSGPVVFADHDVTAPSAPIVVSVEDEGVLELRLHLRRR